MKYLPQIAAVLLFLPFSILGAAFLAGALPQPPPPPAGSLPALFMDAMMPSGYMVFVKVLEIIGGILVVIPRTRNLGLLFLGPIIVNIIAFHVFILQGEGLVNPILGVIVAAALYLLWHGRTAWAGLLRRV